MESGLTCSPLLNRRGKYQEWSSVQKQVYVDLPEFPAAFNSIVTTGKLDTVVNSRNYANTNINCNVNEEWKSDVVEDMYLCAHNLSTDQYLFKKLMKGDFQSVRILYRFYSFLADHLKMLALQSNV